MNRVLKKKQHLFETEIFINAMEHFSKIKKIASLSFLINLMCLIE